jgi:hypothetical protein
VTVSYSTPAAGEPEQTFIISMFRNRQDNRPRAVSTTWRGLIKSLCSHLRLVDKHDAALWSPARFEDGKVRGKENVVEVSVLADDIDDGTDASTVQYWLGDLRYVITSSYSHTPDHPKLRVVIDLTEAIPCAEYDQTWRRANQHLMHCHVDPSTKDAARMYYRPSCPLLTTRATGRGGTMPYQQIIADLNPREPNWWLYEREAAGKTTFLQVRHSDNPSLTPERMKPLEALTGFLRDRLLLGLRASAEGMYFTEFDPRLHVVEPFDIPPEWPRWIAVDYGYAHPFVALWFAREKPGGRIYLYREVSAAGLRDEQQAALILERSQGEQIELVVLDPSMFNQRGEQNRPSIAYIYAAQGVQHLSRGGIVPGMNNRRQGWAIVRRALAHGALVTEQRDVEPDELPRLRIMGSRCPNLVRNLPAMVCDPLDPEDVADKIGHVRTPDDEVDALRYGLCAEAQPQEPAYPTHLTFVGAG